MKKKRNRVLSNRQIIQAVESGITQANEYYRSAINGTDEAKQRSDDKKS